MIDMQNDFITGSLGTPEARQIVDKVADKIRNFDGTIILTKDTHDENYGETLEGKKLPIKHCIDGTAGHNFAPEIEQALKQKLANNSTLILDDETLKFKDNIYVVKKETFGTSRIAGIINEYITSYRKFMNFEIEICGLCTDICVVSNALILRANFPNNIITVYKDCCAGTTPAAHEAALTVMRNCQIDVI
jgi:nicotinamidase-related amidase